MAVGDDFVIVEREDFDQVSASDVAKIRSFLSPTDFDGEGSELQKHLAAHVPGTGKWLFDNDRYKRWDSSHDTGLLWIKGTAGTGKSVIAAQLIRTLQESEASTPVLFFFFRHIIQSNCYPTSAARDLLYQALGHSRRLQGQLRKIVDSYANIDQVPFRELWQPLLDAVRAMPKLYVVTDALDEIQGGPDEFLAGLMELGRIKPDSVKMIVTSRPLPQLEAVLFGASVVSIRLNGAVLAEDISEYVDQRLNSQPQRQFSKDERLLIHRALCGDGQGLFLHARLTLDELLQSSETDSLESQLSRLSSDLGRVYRNLLNEYARRAGISSRFQTIILQWATHSVRPLRLTELAAMVTSLDNGGGLAANQETKATIRTCCGPLLELLENGTLQVIHHSFTEFLCDAGPIDHTAAPELYEYNELKVPSLSSSVDVHRSLASICLDYLMSGCLDYDPPDALDRLARKAKEEDVVLRHQFLLYAANHWLDHASKCDDFDAGFFSKMDSFFLPENPAFRNWFRIYLESSRISQLRYSGSPLHIASFAGLSTYVRYLLAKGKAPDCLDHDFQTPLMWAAMGGHPGVAAVLLEYNAQTTLYDRDGKSPIDIAVENRHPGVLRRLLAASKMETMNLVERRRYPWVVPRATGTFLRDSPLFLACKVGSVEVMRVLMEFIEPRSEAAIGLCWAARHRQRELLRFMLQYPEVATNINQKDDNGNTALFIAAHFQDYASIRILCKNGANASQTSDDIDAPKERPAYEPESKVASHAVRRSHMLTPLHALAGFWNRRYENSVSGFAGTKAARLAVELLIEAGCDINARDSQGKTPLFGWHTDYSDSLLPTLLHCGADARARDNEGGTPLHIMWYRSSQIPSLTMLLQAGADINAARLSDGCTPINAAKHRIREESLNLVAYGADPNSQDRAGNTALHYLCRRGSLTYLRSGWLEVADPKIKNKDGETCLHWLGDCSDARETLKSFIERGVDLEARDALGRTVLLAACARIEADLGSALLEFGADVAAVDYQGKSGER
ncbi:ankyrin repeat-containing domain protein [Aspergillus lucknowensis]|uniref:Ankyrin repeat-containing domain protein n=1 Tax=Aspergillus lucknowensis TaxID=176173 RepID=A0ABR4LH84_9EURO